MQIVLDDENDEIDDIVYIDVDELDEQVEVVGLIKDEIEVIDDIDI